jgi:2-dehydro-3-deoxygluconokinase
MPADVIAFGEVMARLAPPHFQRLEQARSLDLEIGGAELNTGVGLARLGRTVEWVSALPRNAMGQLVANRVREAGVGIEHVQFTEEGRLGLYFLEFGASPRASSILYDRKDSSIALAKPGKFDWSSILKGARWLHLTGITVALSANAAANAEAALRAARSLGVLTSIDLNYRSKLWTTAEAGRVMTGLLPLCDLLIASEGDAELLFGIRGENFAGIAKQFQDRFGVQQVAGVKRETPLVWRNRFGCVGYSNGEFHESPWYEVEIVDRLGAGDAMASGLIHGLLDGDFAKGVEYGAAMGALAHTIPGDLPWVNVEEVEAVLAGQGLRIRR